jgi:hypothetical protein
LKQPAQANQEILGGKIEQHSGIQALMDPASNTVQTEPSKINSIVENHSNTIKTGNYLPTDPDAAVTTLGRAANAMIVTKSKPL